MKLLDIVKKMCYNLIRKEYYVSRGGEKMDAILLSNYVICAFESEKKPITNLKLQKVLYYIQGYFYKKFKKSAFDEEIYNWQYGPVVPVVYFEYNHHGSAPLDSNGSCSQLDFSLEEKQLILTIIKKCMVLPTSKLVAKTHSEAPWKNSTLGKVIGKDKIKLFFDFADPLEIC